MNSQDQDKENEVFYSIGTGTILDRLPRIPRPVLAFGKKDLYSVLINGHDFILPLENSEHPVIGFYTTRTVAAENIRDAEKVAYNLVLMEWNMRGYLKICGGYPSLTSEEITILDEKFRLRSGYGFAFYEDE